MHISTLTYDIEKCNHTIIEVSRGENTVSIEFINFAASPLGTVLMELVSGSTRLTEFKAFSREGYPAVTAIVSEASKILQDHDVSVIKERNFVKQSIGDFVARVMRDAGYIKVGSRSVPGKLFSTGAIWAPRSNA